MDQRLLPLRDGKPEASENNVDVVDRVFELVGSGRVAGDRKRDHRGVPVFEDG
jgi:hypothetical protein